MQHSGGQASVVVRVEVSDEADTDGAAGGFPSRNQHSGEDKMPEASGHGGHHDTDREGEHGPGQEPQPVPVVSSEAKQETRHREHANKDGSG